MSIHLSGPMLSYLLFEQCNSINNQEGFLLGTSVNYATNSVNDVSMHNIKTVHSINIHSHMKCSENVNWCERNGSINLKSLEEMLGEELKNVIGWYKFRRNSSMVPSMKERIIHHNLQKIFCSHKADEFLFFLCTANSTDDGTFVSNQQMMICNNNVFQPVPIEISNLGSIQQPNYHLSPSAIQKSPANAYAEILNDFSKSHGKADDDMTEYTAEVQKLNSTVQQRLEKLCAEMEQEEELLRAHAETVRQLKAQVYPISVQTGHVKMVQDHIKAEENTTNVDLITWDTSSCASSPPKAASIPDLMSFDTEVPSMERPPLAHRIVNLLHKTHGLAASSEDIRLASVDCSNLIKQSAISASASDLASTDRQKSSLTVPTGQHRVGASSSNECLK